MGDSKNTVEESCPLCQEQSKSVFLKDGYDILECGKCEHRFTTPSSAADQHVQSVYGDSYFFDGAAGYTDYLSEQDLLRDRGRRYARILNGLSKPGKILDVGAAAGFILQGFIDEGWSGNGIEPNDTMAKVARSRLGLEVWTGMLETLADDLAFDAVSMIQVLPHFIDPARAMRVVSKVLRPGGLLLIETWNRKSVTARMFGKNWHEYSPPSVLHWFHPAGVERLANRFGLEQISTGRPSKKIMSGHAKSLLKHKMNSSGVGRVASKMLNLIPDRISVPYPAEDLFWSVFRKTDRDASIA